MTDMIDERNFSWLAAQAQIHNRIAEIGCGDGHATLILAANAPGEVCAIDQWLGNGPDPDVMAKQFHANLREYIDSGKVKPARMDPVVFAEKWRALGRPAFDLTIINVKDPAVVEAWKIITQGLLKELS